ncbi:MAG: glycosyltransferase family 2 protein [Myxococcales bacterium]|nr:glycosyltransferase family 2 protein [Myxococcales bacterium]
MTGALAVAGVALGVVAVLLAVPSTVFFVECVASLFRPRAPRFDPTAPRPSAAVLMPAHDEAAVLAETLRALAPELGEDDRVLVVADNCSDATAEIARAEGAGVTERTDAERRGKGYAIVHGVAHLAAAPPDVVVIVDADCRLSLGALDQLAREAAHTGRPTQAVYLFGTGSDSALAAVSALALVVRNLVRPLGLHRLGLPCHLAGSGMAFPFGVLRDAPETGSFLAEDQLMGLQLAAAGRAPWFLPTAQVRSELPPDRGDALGQRRRWEHGFLTMLFRYGPASLARGIARRDRDLIATSLDLCVPPLALLVATLVALAVLGAALVGLGGSAAPLVVTAAALALVGVAVLLAWARHARAFVPFRTLVAAPFYVLWKIPLYLAFFLGRGQKTWQRTKRKEER